jgi:ribosomal protein S11
MNKIYLFLFASTLFFNSFSQYCTTVGPTSTADSNVESVFLIGASGSINYTGCPGVIGLQNLSTTQVVTLTAGGTYTITVDFGTCGGNFSGVGQVWVDFNSDGNFSSNESIGTWQGIPPAAPVPFYFTVPINALTGATRIRVIQREAGTLPINPCESYTWGSAMDFGAIITGGVNCAGYAGDTKQDAIPIASLPYTTSGNTAYCYFNQNLVYNSPDMYYRLIPTAQQKQATVSLCGSSFDTFLSVIDPQGNVIAYNDDGTCGTSSQLTFSTQGIDTAFIIVEGWGNAMGTFQMTIDGEYLAIDEMQFGQFSVFPNPAKDAVTFKGLNDASIQITDIKGNLILTLEHYKESALDIDAFKNGVYFVLATQNDQTSNAKFIVNK